MKLRHLLHRYSQMKTTKHTLKRNILNLTKETPEERKERIRIGGMYTRIVKSKKGKGSYNRQQYKQGR